MICGLNSAKSPIRGLKRSQDSSARVLRELAMEEARLRRAEWAYAPFARAKTRPASRAAGASYPLGKFRDDFQSASEIAGIGTHYKREYITASATAKAVEDTLCWMNVERWISF